MKVGLVAPCVGVGGGDALMLGLIKHCVNINFTGIYVSNPIERINLDWAKRACTLPPIHCVRKESHKYHKYDGIAYHDTPPEAVMAAVGDADLILSWCVHTFDTTAAAMLDCPVIDYAQNSDQYAKKVIDSNKHIANYHAACSESAAKILGTTDYRVINNGIDPSRVSPGIGRDKQRKIWGLEDKKILLFMGRFVKEKHPDKAITCLSHLPPDWVTIFTGHGYQNTELYKLAQMLHPDRVFFVEPQYHVGDILAAADVFILPSDFEGHSLSLCEAWLAGIPTVFSDADAMLEQQDKWGPLGTVIPRLANPQTVADAVLEADTNGRRLIANARDVVWQNYTLPTIASQWEAYFDTVLFDWRRKKRNKALHIVKRQEIMREP